MNIIITGASRGIGYETAKLLSAEHKVIAIARRADNLDKLKKEANSVNIFPVTFDFEKGNIKKELLPEILSSLSLPACLSADTVGRQGFGRGTGPKGLSKESSGLLRRGEVAVDVLINNAATFIKKPFGEILREDFEKIFRVNVFSIAELMQSVLPLMFAPSPSREELVRKDSRRSPADSFGGVRPHVLNIASMGGIQGSVKFPGLSAYSASKGALITLTECLAEEYKNRNVSFNAIAFGAVQTEMLAEAFPNFKAPITAKEAAEFVAHFALNGQKFFNGKVLQMALSTP